jgi:hypothetical protein
MEPLLTKLETNILKSLTQNDAEEIVTGKVLEHGKNRGYCFLMSLLYGLEELGGNDLRAMIEKVKTTPLTGDYFDKETGSVGWADGLARILTSDRSGLKRITSTDNLDVIRNVAFNARPIDKLFLLVHTPGHYSYCRMNGNYSNPLGDKPISIERVVGWELWKVL